MTNRDTLDDPKPTFEDLTLLPSQAAGKGYSHASRIERGLVIQPDTVTDFGQYRPSLSSIKALDAAKARLFSSNDRDPTLSTSHSKPVVTPTANSSRARHPATPDATPTNSSGECHAAAPNGSSITTPVGTSAAVNLTNRGRHRSNRSGNRQRAKSAAAGTRHSTSVCSPADAPTPEARSSLRQRIQAATTGKSSIGIPHYADRADRASCAVNCSCGDPHADDRLLVPCSECSQMYHAACVQANK